MTRKLHTEQQVAEMIDRYREGASVIALGREYGGSHRTILNVLERNGIQRRAPGRAAWRDFTDDQRAEMARRWHAGDSQTAIAKTFGTAQYIISKALIEAGIEPVARMRNQRGARNSTWRGGRTIMNGYPAVRVEINDPLAEMRMCNGYVLENRLVMARALGRPLTSHETVHHKDGDPLNCDLTNLQLRQGRHGRGAAMACLDCGSPNVGPVDLADPT